jgi:hypothetical protein
MGTNLPPLVEIPDADGVVPGAAHEPAAILAEGNAAKESVWPLRVSTC